MKSLGYVLGGLMLVNQVMAHDNIYFTIFNNTSSKLSINATRVIGGNLWCGDSKNTCFIEPHSQQYFKATTSGGSTELNYSITAVPFNGSICSYWLVGYRTILTGHYGFLCSNYTQDIVVND